MVLNVQITMTNVLGWSCLIHDFQNILKIKIKIKKLYLTSLI